MCVCACVRVCVCVCVCVCVRVSVGSARARAQTGKKHGGGGGYQVRRNAVSAGRAWGGSRAETYCYFFIRDLIFYFLFVFILFWYFT